MNQQDLEDKIVHKFPYPIAEGYLRFINCEPTATLKYGILLDIAESYLHYLSTVLLSVYALEKEFDPKLTERLIEKFHKGKWGCGDYVEMMRELCRFYEKNTDKLPYPELPAFFFAHQEVINKISSTRNKKWGHATGKAELFYVEHLPELQQHVETLLQDSLWLAHYPLWMPRQWDESQSKIVRADNYQGSQKINNRAVNIPIHAVDIENRQVILERTFLLTDIEKGRYWVLFPVVLYAVQHNVGQMLLLQDLDWKDKANVLLKKLIYVDYTPQLPNYNTCDKDNDVLDAMQRQLKTLLLSLPLEKQQRFKIPEVKILGNPYRELKVFQVADKPVFFGREKITQQLLTQINNTSMTVLTGGSGSGKSSLILAGICANLSEDWQYSVPCRLGNAPFLALQHTLAALLKTDIDLSESHEARLWIDAIEQIIATENKRLLLIIDPIEELFTQNNAPIPQKFLSLLVQIIQHFKAHSAFHLLIGLRADFLSVFNDLFNVPFAVTLLPPLSKNEVIAIVEEPAKYAQIALEAGLVDRILTDMGFSLAEQDSVSSHLGLLPLLEFALTALFEKSKASKKLSHVYYNEIKGVKGALLSHIEQQLVDFTPEEMQELMWLLLHLIVVKEDGYGRRPLLLSELSPLQGEIADTLVSARLLVRGENTLELAHEALIQHWAALQDWLTQHREFKLWEQKLQLAVQEWDNNQRDATFLWAGARLAEAELKLGEFAAQLDSVERDFIKVGVERREEEAREKERQRQEKLRLQKRNIQVLTVSLIVSVGLGGVGWWQWEEATWQRNLALEQKTLATQQKETALSILNQRTFDYVQELQKIPGTKSFLVKLAQHNEQALARIAELDPDTPQAWRNQAANLITQGDLWMVLGDIKAAQQSYQQAQKLLEQAAARAPDDADAQRDLSVSYNKIGDVQLRLGNANDALRAYQQSLEIRERLAASDPTDAQAQRDLSISYNNIGDVQLRLGNANDALRAFQQSLEISERLAASDPTDAQAQRDLMVSHYKLAQVYVANEDWNAALARYQQALSITEKLAAQSPEDAEAQNDLAVLQADIAEIQERLKNP